MVKNGDKSPKDTLAVKPDCRNKFKTTKDWADKQAFTALKAHKTAMIELAKFRSKGEMKQKENTEFLTSYRWDKRSN